MRKPDRRVLTCLYDVTAGRRPAMALLILMQTVRSLVNIGVVLLMRRAVDGAAAHDAAQFRIALLGMIALELLRLLLNAAYRLLDENVRATVENNLKRRLLHRLLWNPFAEVDAVHTGEWMNRMASDTTVIAHTLTELPPNLIGMLVKLIGVIAMLTVMIPEIALLLVPAAVLLLGVTALLRRFMKNSHKEVQAADGRLRAYIQERLSCMMVVRAFRAENTAEAEAAANMQEHKRARMKKVMISDICNTGFAAMMNALYIVGFAYCGIGILRGTVSYGTLLAVTQLIGQVQAPFVSLSGMIPRFYAMTASTERLLEAETAPLPEHGDNAVRPAFSSLRMEGVSFAYPGEDRAEILSRVSLTVNRGDFCALTGASGCGKSTLFKLLLCLYQPTAGRITVCTDARGEDTSEAQSPLTHAHRSLFAYVPQGNQLMSGTVREIVTFADTGDGAADPERRIRDALRIACADGFVSALERGLDTELGEHGAGLSEGQMQRLALARAIYTDAPILLLDESTSALDEETERRVLENLRSMTDKTVFIVTHRPAALSFCNCRIEM